MGPTVTTRVSMYSCPSGPGPVGSLESSQPAKTLAMAKVAISGRTKLLYRSVEVFMDGMAVLPGWNRGTVFHLAKLPLMHQDDFASGWFRDACISPQNSLACAPGGSVFSTTERFQIRNATNPFTKVDSSIPKLPQKDVMGTRKGHRIIDLFSGVGGLSLGSARAGFVVSCAIDNEPLANETHRRNFPDTVHLRSDIAKLSGNDIKRKLCFNGDDIAGVVGGPPCQGFSAIGRRDKNDARNMSFVHFFRIVSEVLPRFFLVENVPGIMHGMYDEIRERAFSFVSGRYVLLPEMQLLANLYGAATSRRRVFFFGYRTGEMDPLTIESFYPPSNVEAVHVKDALNGLPTKIDPNWQEEEQSWQVVGNYSNGSFGQRLNGHIPSGIGDQYAIRRLTYKNEVSGFLGTAHTAKVTERFAKTECGHYDTVSKSYRLDPDGYCPTLRAGTGPDQGSFQAVRPIHPTEARVVTPREAARLQGFPDWFQFSPTKWHSFRQIGNSVSPILAERILAVVAESLGIVSATEDQK